MPLKNSMTTTKQLKININNMILDFNDVEKVIKVDYCTECERKFELIESVHIGGAQKGEKFRFKRGCECENIELARREKEKADRLMSEKMNFIFNTNSLMNDALKECSFSNYTPKTTSQQDALNECLAYVREYDKHNAYNLLLTGSYGVGKSHLSVSIVRELIEKGVSCIFTSAPKLLTKIKATYNKKSEISEDELLTMFEKVDLLVIDDLGAEKDDPNGENSWTVSKLFEIIDARAGKHTIYTTNYNSVNLRKKIGERNFSRMMLKTKPLKLDGDDHRLKEF